MIRAFVTGAAGFIGSNFVRRVLATRDDWRIVAFDALTYAGNLANLDGLESDGRLTFVRGDIRDADAVRDALEPGTDLLINFAAESHVDRSIHGSAAFVQTNVGGTQVLLDAARERSVGRFVQISTDEVYGSLGPTGRFTEDTPLAPNSPYSASKAGADLLVRSYNHTHSLDTIITRCSNNYGPYQFPEKIIPLFITNLLEGRKVPVYGDGLNVRDWIHVHDHCDAILAACQHGRSGAVYNIGADCEKNNLELTHDILAAVGADENMIEFVTDRLGHDRRYAVDSTRIRNELGWRPQHDFAEALAATVAWYRNNEPWWRAIKSGAYREYYALQYGQA